MKNCAGETIFWLILQFKIHYPCIKVGENVKKVIKMREMADHQKGIIRKVSANGEMGRRIREMGLVSGTPIQIQGRAPLRDPVAVKIIDYILTLRNDEASNILVEVETDTE